MRSNGSSSGDSPAYSPISSDTAPQDGDVYNESSEADGIEESSNEVNMPVPSIEFAPPNPVEFSGGFGPFLGSSVDLFGEVPGSLPSVPAAGVAQPSRYNLSDQSHTGVWIALLATIC